MMRRLPLNMLLALAIPLLAGAASAQEVDRSMVLEWYRQGMVAYEAGRFEEAISFFERIMQSDAAVDVALEIRQDIADRDITILVKMMKDGGTIAQFSEYILQKSNLGAIKRVTDPEQIRSWVTQAVESEKFEDRWAALINLDAKVGPYAMPVFVPYLLGQRPGQPDTQNPNWAVNAVVALRHMGEQMTIPVIQVLNSADPALRRTAAVILGHYRDHRALPALARVAQNPNEDQLAVSYAEEAIVNTGGRDALSTDFRSHYLKVAREYYHHDPSIVMKVGAGEVVWMWDEGQPDLGAKLQAREVPAYLYNEVMAEHACEAILDHDPSNLTAWALLVSANFAQVIETWKILEAIEMNRAAGGEGPTASEQAMLEQNQALLTKAEAVARSAGLDAVYAALDMAIKDRRTLVGVHCVQVLEEMESRYNAPGKALVSALHTADKRLRYHAALSLVGISPLRDFNGSKDVVPALEAALGEMGTRSILVITDDEETRNLLRAQLEGLGYAPYFADTGWDGVEQAKRFPSHDLVILDTRLAVHPVDLRTGRADPRMAMGGGEPDDPNKSYERGMYYSRVIEFLKRDIKSRTIPILLLADPSNEQIVREATEAGAHRDSIKGYVVRPLAPEAYAGTLAQVFEEIKVDFKKRSTEIAGVAAMALASIDPEHSIYHVEEATGGLLAVLDASGPERDEVRLHAVHALARIGNPQARPSLLRVFQDKIASIPLRVAAGNALGTIYQRHQITPEGDEMEAFLSALATEPLEVQVAAAQALGQARLDPATRWGIFRTNPVEPVPAAHD